jgi:hypothetical protein
MELKAREKLVRKQKGREAKPQSAMGRVIGKLWKLYEPCLIRFKEEELAELNKKHRTPSLKLQDNGLRTQDNYTFDVLKRDTNGCPCCTHRSTMGFGTETDEANSTNAQRRADAATAGETAFEGVSAEKGCFCYSIDCHGAPDGKGCYRCEELSRKGTKQDESSLEVGYCQFLECDICSHGKDDDGCTCQVKFLEHNRQKIALGWKKKMQQQSKGSTKDGEAKQPPEGTAASVFFNELRTM